MHGVVGTVRTTRAVPPCAAVAGGGGVGLTSAVLSWGTAQAVCAAGAALYRVVGARCAAPLCAVLCAVRAVVA